MTPIDGVRPPLLRLGYISIVERRNSGFAPIGEVYNLESEVNARIAALSAELANANSEIDQLLTSKDELRAEVRALEGTATVEYAMREQLRKELEAVRGAKLRMTGLQIQHVWDFIDGDNETEVMIFYAGERKDIETGETMPAGLYASLAEYPDEGCLYLPPDAEAALPVQARGEK